MDSGNTFYDMMFYLQIGIDEWCGKDKSDLVRLMADFQKHLTPEAKYLFLAALEVIQFGALQEAGQVP